MYKIEQRKNKLISNNYQKLYINAQKYALFVCGIFFCTLIFEIFARC